MYVWSVVTVYYIKSKKKLILCPLLVNFKFCEVEKIRIIRQMTKKISTYYILTIF